MADYLHDLKGRLVSQKDQAIADVLKASPAVGVSFLTWLGSVPIEKWVQFATLVYIILQAYFLVRDRRKARRRKE